tara:strand:+ start:2717 stop:3400 length:684 start_codon:yes stop_codon:yes gene_type:complete
MIINDCVLDLEASMDLEPAATPWIDTSRYENNGAVTNATWEQLPSGLWVETLAGTGNINHTKPVSLSLRAALTIIVWARSTITVAGVLPLVSNYDATPQNAQYTLRINAGRVAWASHGGGGTHSFSGTTLTPIINTWQMYAVTKTGIAGTVTLYLNAIADATTGVSADNKVGTEAARGNTRVGQLGDFAGQRWTGGIAPPLVCNYAFTPGQLLNYYEKTRYLFGVNE